MLPDEIIPMTCDFVFTEIFSNPKNIKIVEHFLAAYFDKNFEDIHNHVTILPRNLELENRFTANKQVDLILDIDGEKINIEMASRRVKGAISRNVVYLCSIHARQLEYAMNDYTKIQRSLQINLNNYQCNKKEIVERVKLTKNGQIYDEKFQIDEVDLVKGKKMVYTESGSKLARWCRVLTAKNLQEFKEAIGEDLMNEQENKEIEREIRRLSANDDCIALYTKLSHEELMRNTIMVEAREEGLEQGIKQGIKQGILQGKQESKYEIVKNMLEDKVAIDLISKYTGYSLQEIKKISKNIYI